MGKGNCALLARETQTRVAEAVRPCLSRNLSRGRFMLAGSRRNCAFRVHIVKVELVEASSCSTVGFKWELSRDDALGVDNSSQASYACVTRQAVVSPRVRLIGALTRALWGGAGSAQGLGFLGLGTAYARTI